MWLQTECFCPPPNSCWNLTPDVMVFGGSASGRWVLGHLGGSPDEWDQCSSQTGRPQRPPGPLHHESRGQEHSPQSTRKSAPTRPRNPSVPRSRPSQPQSWVNLEYLLFKPLALGYFVRAAWRAETNVTVRVTPSSFYKSTHIDLSLMQNTFEM